MSTAPASTVPEEARQETVSAWPRVAWICLAAVAVLLAMYAETIAGLVDNWVNSSSYGHALLVLPICAWLIWRGRAEVASMEARPQWWALLLLPVGAIGWLMGDLLSIRVGRELSLYLMLVAVVLVTLGWRVTWRLGFPLAYLLLTIPVWSMLIPPLQDTTAVVSARSLQMFRVPVFLEGHYMHIPNGQFVVEEVCAGLRFLLATMAIVALHAHLSFHSAWRGWLLFVVAVVSAVVFNWIRVDLIVLAGYLGGMNHPLVTNHIAFGWVMFIVSLAPVIALSWWLQSTDAAPPAIEAGSRPVSARFPGRNLLAAALALLLAVPGVGVGTMLRGDITNPVNVELGALPSLAGFSGPAPAESGLDPQFTTADARTEQNYLDADGRTVSVYVAYYAQQREGKELVSDTNRLYGSAWSGSGAAVIPTNLEDGLPATAVQTLARSSAGDSRLLWYWYYAGGRLTTSRLHAKLLQMLDMPLFRSKTGAAAMIAVSVPAVDAASFEARQLLAQLSRALLPQLKEMLAEADNGT